MRTFMIGLTLLGGLSTSVVWGCTSDDVSVAPEESNDAGPSSAGDAGTPGTFGESDGGGKSQGTCEPPDMLVVLDRSESMNGLVKSDAGPSQSKWDIAVAALGKMTEAPVDTTVRFGLEVFPDVKGSCSSGKILVAPETGKGAAISSALASTQLVGGTPIGAPIDVARMHLSSVKTSSRKQFALLVTDGGETCATAKGLPAVQELAKAGVSTFVIGFGSGVRIPELNNLACAGGTAPDPAKNCKTSATGGLEWVGSGPNLFFLAQDAAALEGAFKSIASKECCGCVK